MRLKDKVAVVTGAASGIGKEIAIVYAREGAKVVIADLNQEGADATAAELMATGGIAMGVAMDVTDEAQVDAGFAKVKEAYGGVRRAGQQRRHPDRRAGRRVRLRQVEEDAGDPPRRRLPDHPRVRCGTMYAGGRGGSVIYMGSVHSKEASVLKAPYVTAKHGLIGLAKVVAKEGAKHGVRANVICPGFVRTPLVEKQIPEQAQGAGHLRGGRDQEGHAQGDRRRRVHDRATTSPRPRCSSPPSRPTRSPASRSWSATAGSCSR